MEEKKQKEEKEEKEQQDFRLSDLLDYFDSPFFDPEIREELEKKLPPLDVEQLLLKGYVTQTIPVTSNIRVVFRSLTGVDREAIARVAWRKGGVQGVTNELLAQLQLAASIDSLFVGKKDVFSGLIYPGGGDLPTLEKYLEAKLERVQQLAEPILILLSQHLTWFSGRIAKVFFDDAADTIRNFCPPPPGDTQQ